MQKLSNKGSTVKRFFSTLVMTSLVVPGILLQVPEVRAAGTAATTVIGNQATATYKDAAGVNSFTSTSNLVSTTVSAVYSLQLDPSSTGVVPTDTAAQQDDEAMVGAGQSQNATPGTTVYFPYTLKNIGNAPDSYTITSSVGVDTVTPANGTSGGFPTTLAGLNEQVYYDANGNGIRDAGDVQITNGTNTISIPADGSIKLIVQYDVPATGLSAGAKALVDLQAKSVGDTSQIDKFNYSRAVFVNDAVVNVTKSVDKTSGDPSTASVADILTYNLNVNNTGNADATNIKIVDSIPTYTDFQLNSITVPSGATIEYDTTTLSGNGFTPVTSAAPDATHFNNSLIPTNQIDASKVKRFRVVIAGPLPGSQTRGISFQVKMNQNTPATDPITGLPVNILNSANYEYKPTGTIVGDPTNAGTPIIPTNTVQTAVNTKSAAEISFAGVLVDGSAVGTLFTGEVKAGTENPAYPVATSDRTTQDTAAAGSYVYFKNVVVNNGNAKDRFNIKLDPAYAALLPAGASVSFFIKTTDVDGVSNSSPLLDTNNDGTVDTGFINGENPTAGSTTAVTTSTFTIVTRVFIPAGTTVATITTATASATSATIPVGTSGTLAAGDTISIGGTQTATVASVTATSITVTAPLTFTSGAKITKSFTAVVDAISTNGGTPLGLTAGTTTTDTTANIIGAISAPSVTLLNENSGTPSSTVDTFTESANGATVAFPLNVNNGGSSNDTFNLTAPTLPAGASVLFYPELASTTGSSPTSTTITVASTTGIAVGSPIIVNGQTLAVGTIVGNVITFANGEKLVDTSTTDTTVIVPGNTPITSTGSLAPAANFQVVGIVTIPANAPPTSVANNVSFTATSTNNGTITSSQPDSIVIPNFRTFTFVADRSGTAPRGGVLFYSHTITNTGNIDELFNISIPANVVGGMTYQLIDELGNPQGIGPFVTGRSVTVAVGANHTYTFQLKVTVPSSFPLNATDSKDITVTETLGGGSKINTDQTTAIDGLISLTKSAETFMPASNTGTHTTDDPLNAVAVLSSFDAAGSTAKPGQVIEYRVKYTNISSQTATKVVITDQIPANTTYIKGSLRVERGSVFSAASLVTQTDLANTVPAVGPDLADAIGAPGTVTGVTFRVDSATAPSPATASSGGDVLQGDSGFVVFRVQVN